MRWGQQRHIAGTGNEYNPGQKWLKIPQVMTGSEFLSFWQEMFVFLTYVFTRLIYADVLGPVSDFKGRKRPIVDESAGGFSK